MRALSFASTLVLLAACSAELPPVDQVHEAELTDDDDKIPEDESPFDTYRFQAGRGWAIHVAMESDDFDPYLWVFLPDGTASQVDDSTEGSTAAVIDLVGRGQGDYTVRANTFFPDGRGDYRLTIRATPAGEGADGEAAE